MAAGDLSTKRSPTPRDNGKDNMAKKIIILNGSPRANGNTSALSSNAARRKRATR